MLFPLPLLVRLQNPHDKKKKFRNNTLNIGAHFLSLMWFVFIDPTIVDRHGNSSRGLR